MTCSWFGLLAMAWAPDVLGSLRYAIEHLRDGLRLVVVLGHNGCGALSAAVDAFLEPAGYLSLVTDQALRSILDRQLIVVQTAARKLASAFGGAVTRHENYREALIEASIVTNAALAAHTVQQELRGMASHDLLAVYRVYLLESRRLWTPSGTGLRAPVKRDLAEFVALGDAIVGCDRIAPSLVQGDERAA